MPTDVPPHPADGTPESTPTPNPNRLLLAFLAVVLALVSAYGFWRLSIEFPRQWSGVAPSTAEAGSNRLALDRALAKATTPDLRASRGVKVPLAWFSTSNGRRVDIVLIEGEMFDRAIVPLATWRQLGPNLLLVSSVDERRSAFGGLAEATSRGCAITANPADLQALGEASVDACGGIYRDRFGITSLARLSVIVDENPGSEDRPCYQQYGLIEDPNGYQACVREALSSSIPKLFRMIGSGVGRPVEGAIFPAIATGAGGLSKAAFYRTLLSNDFLDALKNGTRMPRTIYLQVRNGDDQQRWLETRVGISSAVADAVQRWNDAPHPIPSSEWLTLTGVSLGGMFLLLAVATGAKGGSLGGLLVGGAPVLIVSWLIAAVGIASTFKAFVSLVPTTYGPYAQIVAGVVAALLAGPLTRAAEAAKEAIKSR